MRTFAIFALLLLAACSHRLVEVEKPVIVEHTTTQHHTDLLRDTLLMRDSVYHYIHGDTTVIERWHHFREVTKINVTDTIRDTVPVVTQVVKTQIKEVEKKPPWWKQTLIYLGIAFIAVAACLIFYKYFKI